MNPSKTIRAYTYISSKAACDPAKTIYVCAPEANARSEQALEKFALESGWQEIAEENEAILILPVAENGWENMPTSLLLDYYNETKNGFLSRSGSAIWGRTGTLWCWDTILYVVGYQEGATFAGNTLVSYPNFAAACALVGGLPTDYSAGDKPSNHWMVRNVSEDYALRNREIPVCLWLFDSDRTASQEAMDYFSSANAAGEPRRERVGAVDTIVRENAANPAQQVRLVAGRFADEKQRSSFIFDKLLAHRVRWKNGPDGTLAFLDGKAEFYRDPRFLRSSVEANGIGYDYFVHLPKGKSPDQVKGLPVVFTIHGRGEPAWMFTKKNGWVSLADETGEFVLVSPDSPGNIWFIQRDSEIFAKIVMQLKERFGIDGSRVYLTGFSNGAVMVREMALVHPELFAAASPSNGPWFDTTSMQQIDASKAPADLTVTKRRIVLVPLNRGIIGGESARLLGSLIVGLMWTLALSRANVPPEQRHLVSVYIDELQDYLSLPTDLSDALAQARGLGVGMTLAHQYRGQLPPEIKAGVDANARNNIIFGLNGTDAKEMTHQAPGLTEEDFMLLPRYQIYTNIMQDHKATGWMQGITYPPSKPIRLAAELKAESMRRYGRPAEEVETAFLKLLERLDEDENEQPNGPPPNPHGRSGRGKIV